MLFLPQLPYMPIGSLRAALCFPLGCAPTPEEFLSGAAARHLPLRHPPPSSTRGGPREYARRCPHHRAARVARRGAHCEAAIGRLWRPIPEH